MSTGLKVYGPNGSIWLDTNEIVTRVTHEMHLADTYSPDPVVGSINGQPVFRRTFPCIYGKTPWIWPYKMTGNISGFGITALASNNDGAAHLDYYLTDIANVQWPPGSSVTIKLGET